MTRTNGDAAALTIETLEIAGRTFRIERPRDDEPLVRDAIARGDDDGSGDDDDDDDDDDCSSSEDDASNRESSAPAAPPLSALARAILSMLDEEPASEAEAAQLAPGLVGAAARLEKEGGRKRGVEALESDDRSRARARDGTVVRQRLLVRDPERVVAAAGRHPHRQRFEAQIGARLGEDRRKR